MTENDWIEIKKDQINGALEAMERQGQDTVGDEALTCLLEDIMDNVRIILEQN